MNRDNTSSAFDYDIFDEIRFNNEKANREIEERKQQIIKAKEKATAKNRKKLVCSILVAFVVACVILSRNVAVIESVSKVNALENRLAEIKNDNTKMELNLEQSVDLKHVEEVATLKLGMKRPDKFQTVYLDVTQNNYAEVVAPTNQSNEFRGVFSVMCQGVVNVLEYLQ